ncbi:MAG: triose-phosphate isomerase [Bacteroidales bacterium]|nr:triose-phosphate isomerase [Bacteroidales bacterium]MBQ4198219.1 triose-phosphate isomerase [Bacteroidales bacterium]
MRQKIVAGNWKMNTTLSEGIDLVNQIVAKIEEVPQDVKLIVNTPFTHLFPVSKIIGDIKCPFCRSKISLGAQNCADKEKGAYTGEVSAKMLASVGKAVGTVAGAPEGAVGAPVEYVILGHSERRGYYGETNAILLEKIKLALAEGLKVIYCVGEALEERKAGKHFEVVGNEIKEVLFSLSPEQMANVIVAYEPIWAIGTGETATKEQAQEIHEFIRKTLAEKFGTLAEETSILYGGSCKPSNAKELFSQKDIDGGLIGGASLKAEDFIAIAKSY